MFVKPEARQEARKLREQAGLSIREIADRLAVSKSSVSLWVRDVPLTPEQQAVLLANDPVRNGRLLGTQVYQARCRRRRLEAQEHGRALARQNDPVHRGGCMLHGAEGSKTRNCVQLVNADADLLKPFLDFLRTCYAVPRCAVTFSVNCFLGNGLALP
jgi:Helix-turn-helix